MKTYHSFAISAAAIFAAAGIACPCFAQQGQSSGQNNSGAQQQSPSQGSSGSRDQSAQGSGSAKGDQSFQQQAPEGFVLVREDVVYLMANEPQNHLLRAMDNLALKDKQKAAGELDVAATYIDSIDAQDKSGKSGGQQQSLSDCADKLRQTAKDIRNGSLNDPKQLSQQFARIEITLADHFQKMADQELQSHKQVKAGYDLRAAANSLEQALVWSNTPPDANRMQAIQSAQFAGMNLLQPSQNAGSKSPGQSGQPASGQQPMSDKARLSAQASGLDPHQASQELAKQIDQFQSKIAQGHQDNQGNPGSHGQDSSGKQASEK